MSLSVIRLLRGRAALLGTLAACLIAAGVVVALSPVERTMGADVRYVYVHVALAWTGLTGLAAAGLNDADLRAFNHL
jgi:ABC-type transport system involved in cytochrome c biogenesis permease subunit